MIVTVISFVVVLSILVFFHELGHYLAARHVGVRVLQFSIGFPPKLFGRKVGETEYLVSSIPLGGYVRLEGQNIIDENPDDPRNYASKSVLQRFYILAAGPVANLVLALLVISAVFMFGVESPAYRTSAPVIASVQAETPAALAGFREGDRLLRVAGTPVATWNDVYEALAKASLARGPIAVTVERAGKTEALRLDQAAVAQNKALGWRPLIEPMVGMVSPGSAAREAGMQAGDRILAIDGVAIARWDQISQQVQRAAGKRLAVEIGRGREKLAVQVQPRRSGEGENWLIGISPGTALERHPPLQAIALGSARLWEITRGTFYFLGQLLTGRGSLDALGGPVKIGAVIGEAARTGGSEIAFLMAVISLQLGIFNLLPIPALDGGHIFLLGIELLKGGPLTARFRERAQMIGLALILLLILVVTYNDIRGLIS
ncbi:MAG: RIP metalloprotease RseP [Candidatus Lambdaproteobacteria bacterium]|nr:RIP metalloprotease RseP [Candidatus Lambdaproteobacteria bacterium]